MVVLAVAVEDLAHELHLRVQVHLLAQHLGNAAAVVPDLEVLFFHKADFLKPFHFFNQRLAQILE